MNKRSYKAVKTAVSPEDQTMALLRKAIKGIERKMIEDYELMHGIDEMVYIDPEDLEEEVLAWVRQALSEES